MARKGRLAWRGRTAARKQTSESTIASGTSRADASCGAHARVARGIDEGEVVPPRLGSQPGPEGGGYPGGPRRATGRTVTTTPNSAATANAANACLVTSARHPKLAQASCAQCGPGDATARDVVTAMWSVNVEHERPSRSPAKSKEPPHAAAHNSRVFSPPPVVAPRYAPHSNCSAPSRHSAVRGRRPEPARGAPPPATNQYRPLQPEPPSAPRRHPSLRQRARTRQDKCGDGAARYVGRVTHRTKGGRSPPLATDI